MVKTIAQIVEVSEGGVRFAAERQSACSSCASAKNCGVSSLSKIFSNQSLTFDTPSLPNAKQGDWYVIGIEQSTILKAASIIYLIPLVMMIGAAVLGLMAGASDGGVALASLAGLILGLVAARYLARSSRTLSQTTPTILGPAEDEPSKGDNCAVLD